MKQEFNVIGEPEFILKDQFGNIKQHFKVKNLIVASGKSWIAARMIAGTDAVMSHMAIGTGTASPAAANTTLATEIARVALTSTTGSGNQVTYSAFFPAGAGTGAITEAGILNAGALGTMLARATFAQINKDTLDTLTINWTVTVV